ncbi:MAG TPA: PilN domain-containing protein [Rhodocyclaceae bacterium]|jgi:type IV pilus assembly protein PilN|nr:PilN domain-containing protein [Rhodocyclaceae bacterium]
MMHINLLPHREEKRKARRVQFYAMLGAVFVLVCVIAALGFGVIAARIDVQNDSNDFLRSEIAILNKQIAEIKDLKQQTDALLARKRVIELLQANRAETVHIFNEFAKRVPDGIYLRKISESGNRISITGYAQANARVSTLMQAFEDSPILEKPELVEIHAEVVGGRRLSAFSMFVNIKREEQNQAGAKGKKP